jgi:hypothetical protein
MLGREAGGESPESSRVPAPVTSEKAMPEEQEMDLRDWFAGHALQGLLAGPNAPKKSGAESPEQYAMRVAEEAYLFAEAMMREQAKLAGASQGSADDAPAG